MIIINQLFLTKILNSESTAKKQVFWEFDVNLSYFKHTRSLFFKIDLKIWIKHVQGEGSSLKKIINKTFRANYNAIKVPIKLIGGDRFSAIEINFERLSRTNSDLVINLARILGRQREFLDWQMTGNTSCLTGGIHRLPGNF